MPRLILVPDALEHQAREHVALGLGSVFKAQAALGILGQFIDLLDASRDRQDARAAKHDADNRALAALIDPCTCGDPDNNDYIHRYSGQPCRRFDRVDL
jgi:hypothetical protein